MKKIEKTVKVERTDVMFEAVDGTIFNDMDQCAVYEKSAKCAIRAALNDIVVVHTDGDVFPGGNSDQEVFVVKPMTDDDIKTVRQFEALIGLKWDEKYSCKTSNDDKGKLLILTVGYDEDWIDVRSLDNIITDLSGVPQGSSK